MTRRLWIGAAVVILSNALMITFVTFDTLGRFLLVAAVIFAAVALACRSDARRLPLIMIVIITAAVQLPGLFSYPVTSDDAYRYVWDGRVQLAGIDPYHYVPLDPALAGLRDPQLFPPGEPPLINRPGGSDAVSAGRAAVVRVLGAGHAVGLGQPRRAGRRGAGGGGDHRRAGPLPR